MSNSIWWKGKVGNQIRILEKRIDLWVKICLNKTTF